MADREKVLKGLEICSSNYCTDCPYEGSAGCINKLERDALALLKEQEKKKNHRIPFSPDSNTQWTS